MNYEQYVIVNQDGINQERGTPAWYAGASKFDIARSTLWGGIGSGQGGRYPDRYNIGGVGLLCHRLAQRQGRLPVQLGPLREHARHQRRPAAALHERGAHARSASTTRRFATWSG